jgi:quinol monooxygenase YgiN
MRWFCFAPSAFLAVALCGCGGSDDDDKDKDDDDKPEPGKKTVVAILEFAIPNPESVQKYRELTTALESPTRSEEGCIRFDVYEDTDSDGNLRIWQYLVFKDTDAHQFHLQDNNTLKWIADVESLVNTSTFYKMHMADDEEPLACLKQEQADPFVYVGSWTAPDSESLEALKEESPELIEKTREEEGNLYYDQLVPQPEETGSAPVMEVMMFTTEDAFTEHMQSEHVKELKEDAALGYSHIKVKMLTTMEACAQASTFI